MGRESFNENVQQMFRRRIPDETYGKEILVGVKDEQQASLPRVLLGSFGPRRSGRLRDVSFWAENFPSGVAEPFEDILKLSFVRLPLSSKFTTTNYTMQEGPAFEQEKRQMNGRDYQLSTFRILLGVRLRKARHGGRGRLAIRPKIPWTPWI